MKTFLIINLKNRNLSNIFILNLSLYYMAQRKKIVSFWARKKITKPVKVKFRTSSGKIISFKATKKITKLVKVKFKARK